MGDGRFYSGAPFHFLLFVYPILLARGFKRFLMPKSAFAWHMPVFRFHRAILSRSKVFACLLLAAASVAGMAQVARWNPELIQSLKTLSLDQLFAKYEGRDHAKRSQAAYLREIMERTNSVEFLSGKLKKAPAEPDTSERLEAREKAVQILGKMGARAKPAVPLLVAAFEDGESIRMRVGNALAALGPVAIGAREALLEELHFQNPLAARSLFAIDPTSESVLEAVIVAVSDPSREPGFRHETVEAFYECKVKSDRVKKFLQTLAFENGNPLSERAKRQLEMLESKARRHRPPASEKFTDADASTLLARLKENPDDNPAAVALAKLSPTIREQAMSLLVEALKQKTVRFPANTLSRIGLFGPAAKQALPILMEHAAGDDFGPANNAIFAIGEIGPEAIEAKPVVEAALLDGGGLIRWRAANTLCLIDPDQLDRHLETLMVHLKEGSDYGIRSLGNLGPRASKAAPRLFEALENDSLRLSAAEALLKIQPESASKVANAIVKDLQSDSVHARDTAARLLGEVGPAAASALPSLRDAAASQDLEFATIAKESIAKIEKRKDGL